MPTSRRGRCVAARRCSSKSRSRSTPTRSINWCRPSMTPAIAGSIVGFNRRFSPLLQDMRAAFARGRAAGPAISCHRRPRWRNHPGICGPRSKAAASSARAAMFIDVLSWWLGAEPVRVSRERGAQRRRQSRRRTSTFADGSVASLSLSHRWRSEGAASAEALRGLGQYRLLQASPISPAARSGGAGQRRQESTAFDKAARPDAGCLHRPAVASEDAMPIALDALLCDHPRNARGPGERGPPGCPSMRHLVRQSRASRASTGVR